MSEPGARRTKELFLDFLELEQEERELRLQALSDRDPTAFQRVSQLLQAHQKSATMDRGLLASWTPPLSPALPLGEVGETIGRYEIEQKLGEGGAGVVFRARQLDVGRTVALKLLRAGRLASEVELRRFRAEAEAVAVLDHPNIVPLYEIGEHQGHPFFTMKLIDGDSLAEAIPRFQGDFHRIAKLLAVVAQAIQHGHDRGILHRDLKPSNILLDQTGQAFVADFGIAKRTDHQQSFTRSGWMAGTPAYMAPEQFEAKKQQATVRIDVYGLGCLLYELLTGHPAFEGESAAEVMQKVWQQRPRFSATEMQTIPRDLRVICLRCLEKEAPRRYASAAAVAHELHRWSQGEPIHARTVSLAERIWLQWKRKPLVSSLFALVLLLAAALVISMFHGSLVLRESYQQTLQAQQEAQNRLREAYLSQARAERSGRLIGRRFRSLQILERAAALNTGADLVNEALACMALTDVDLGPTVPLPNVGKRVAAFDPELPWGAVAGEEGEILVLETPSGAIRHRLSLAKERAWYLCFSPGGRYLAAKSHGRNQNTHPAWQVWDLESGELKLRREEVVWGRALAFHSNQEQILVGGNGGKIRFYSLASGEELHELNVGGTLQVFAFSPKGGRLAVAHGIGRVDIFDIETWKPLASLDHAARVYGLDWSPDGEQILTGCADGVAYLRHWSEASPVRKFSGHKAEVVEVKFSDQGRLLWTNSWDGMARLYESHGGSWLLRHPWSFVAPQRNGDQLWFIQEDRLGSARIGHGDRMQSIAAHRRKGPSAVAVDLTGGYLASGAADGLRLLDAHSGRRLASWDQAAVNGLAFQPSSNALWASSNRGLLHWSGGVAMESSRNPPEIVLDQACNNLGFQQDGRRLVFRQGRSLVLWDAEAGRELLRLQGPQGANGLRLSADGKWLGIGAWRGAGTIVWALKDAEKASDGPLSEGAVIAERATSFHLDESTLSLEFGPKAKYLAVGRPEAYHLYRMEDWQEVWQSRRPSPFSELPGSMAFSPDGRFLAVNYDQQRVQVLEVATGTSLGLLQAPDWTPLTRLRFGPEGRFLVAGTSANRIQRWNLVSAWEELHRRGLWPYSDGQARQPFGPSSDPMAEEPKDGKTDPR
ncbi:MAG: hypothetical protein DWQ01_19305 [Planctomycetota bacterium]|nr:MAG: hypothetical protein DWQ01_19305 [Planctomycetota bacterium]